MGLRDLLVHLDRAPHAHDRLRLAADLACRHAARLTALFVAEPSETETQQRSSAELGLASPAQIRQLSDQHRALLVKAERELRAELAHEQIERQLDARWLSVHGEGARAVLQQAQHADIAIVGDGRMSANASIGPGFPEHLLLASGRPVIRVPASEVRTLGRRLALAWNGSDAAARAFHAALPLMDRADLTTLVTINPDELKEGPCASTRQQLVEQLRQRGVAVDTIESGPVRDDSIADALQEKAQALGCDLLIVGAFGHARLRERLLGGVTRRLLAGARLPLMLAH